jgi:hypothetical protein
MEKRERNRDAKKESRGKTISFMRGKFTKRTGKIQAPHQPH